MCKRLGLFGLFVSPNLARRSGGLLVLVLVLILIVVPNAATASATAPSTYGYYGQLYLTDAFTYYSLAYDDAPIGTNGMIHKAVDSTCIQCHGGLANAPVGNTYAFEAYLYSYYAAQYAAAGYSADVKGNKAAAKTYYFYAYTFGAYAWTYGVKAASGQFFNKAGATDAATGNSFASTAYLYCYYASQGK